MSSEMRSDAFEGQPGQPPTESETSLVKPNKQTPSQEGFGPWNNWGAPAILPKPIIEVPNAGAGLYTRALVASKGSGRVEPTK